MQPFPVHSHHLDCLPLYSIAVEPEDYDQAREASQSFSQEFVQWQAYLNALTLFSVARWLETLLPGVSIPRQSSSLEWMGQLEIRGCRIGVIATEHSLDEVFYIPQPIIASPAMQAHYYVLVEVLEEHEQSIIRGFLSHDRVIATLHRLNLQPSETGFYPLPLSALDGELNHLLAFCRILSPSPAGNHTSSPVVDAVKSAIPYLEKTRTKLNQWVEGLFDHNWQLMETLINPDHALALGTRDSLLSTRRGKLLDLGIQLGEQHVALLITVVPEPDDKLAVTIQIHPTGRAKTLPRGLILSLISSTGQRKREVESRQSDNYIQLPVLRGKPGTCFEVEIRYDTLVLLEEFEL